MIYLVPVYNSKYRVPGIYRELTFSKQFSKQLV